MSYGPYPQYKESGVEWLGEVPEHWNLLPCRSIVTEQNKRNTEGLIAGYLSLMANVGVIPYEEKGDVGNKKPDDLSKCKVVQKGDLVINSMNYGIGSYGLSKYTGVCSPVYIVLEPKKSIVDTRFALRIFEEKSFQSFAQSFGNGILAHRSAIGWDDLKNIGTAIPPLKEQSQIARFLDHETGKIDGLIAEQEKLIELLKEKRQATISHAVTKGLNPDAPMKYSGVEWLGEVPEHWDVVRLKFSLSEPLSYGANEAAEYDDPNDPRYIRITDMNSDGTLRDDTFKSLPLSIAQTYLLKHGDVLLARSGATVGKSFIYRREMGAACYAGYLIKASMDDSRLIPDYFSLYTLSNGYWEYIAGENIQATIQNVSAEKYDNLPVALPPIAEQRAIVEDLMGRVTQYDTLLTEALRGIELLKERRSAIISAAVTGKIDVRNWKPEGEAA